MKNKSKFFVYVLFAIFFGVTPGIGQTNTVDCKAEVGVAAPAALMIIRTSEAFSDRKFPPQISITSVCICEKTKRYLDKRTFIGYNVTAECVNSKM